MKSAIFSFGKRLSSSFHSQIKERPNHMKMNEGAPLEQENPVVGPKTFREDVRYDLQEANDQREQAEADVYVHNFNKNIYLIKAFGDDIGGEMGDYIGNVMYQLLTPEQKATLEKSMMIQRDFNHLISNNTPLDPALMIVKEMHGLSDGTKLKISMEVVVGKDNAMRSTQTTSIDVLVDRANKLVE